MRGDGNLILRGRIWYLRTYVNGREYRVSTRTTSRKKALAMLAARAARRAEVESFAPERRHLNAGLRALHSGSISGGALMALRQPIVYAWLRGDQVLYVGKGEMGMYRPLHPRHHRLRGVAADDEVRFWCCADAEEAARFELELIRKWRPSLNRRPTPPAESVITPDGEIVSS